MPIQRTVRNVESTSLTNAQRLYSVDKFRKNNLFWSLAEQATAAGLNWRIFKGREHLAQDVMGERGDIDILVEARHMKAFVAVARSVGFWRCNRSPFGGYGAVNGFFLIGWDIENDWRILLHVHSKPTITVRLKKIPLTVFFVYGEGQQTKACERTNIDGLQFASDRWMNDYQDVRARLRTEMRPRDWARAVFVGSVVFDGISVRCYRFDTISLLFCKVWYRILSFASIGTTRPRGAFIVLVGVDGSGKSTTAEDLTRSRVLRDEWGVRKMYFGSGGYSWARLASHIDYWKHSNVKVLWWALSLYAIVCRKSRVLKAWFFRSRGCVVIGDRYFYDSQLVAEVGGSRGLLRTLARKFAGWAPMDPDFIIYLRVHPEIAFARKGEHGVVKLESLCRAYDEMMEKISYCETIDANRPYEGVSSEVRWIVRRLLADG